MPTVRIPSRQRLILDGVSWERYTRLLRDFSDRGLRLTYDRGILEIMTLSREHESVAELLGRIVVALTEALDLPIEPGRSVTLRRRRNQRGLESDNCYWIAHEAAIRGRPTVDLRKDPPPDLAIEVDLTHSSIPRMEIYAKLGVPEVWRYDEKGLAFFTRNAEGKYDSAPLSATFTLPITPADLMPFVRMRGQMDQNAIIRRFRVWLQSRMTPDDAI